MNPTELYEAYQREFERAFEQGTEEQLLDAILMAETAARIEAEQ